MSNYVTEPVFVTVSLLEEVPWYFYGLLENDIASSYTLWTAGDTRLLNEVLWELRRGHVACLVTHSGVYIFMPELIEWEIVDPILLAFHNAFLSEKYGEPPQGTVA